jgi:hypothetical protein
MHGIYRTLQHFYPNAYITETCLEPNNVQVHLGSIKAGFTVCQLHLACIKYQHWASFAYILSSDLLRSMRQ